MKRLNHRMRETQATGTFLMLAALCAANLGADWPQWRGPSRDGVVAEVKLPAPWPPKLSQAWSVVVGEGHASPLRVGERIYQFARLEDAESLLCLDRQGQVLWKKGYAAPYKPDPAAESHRKGPKSTPLAHGGFIFTYGIHGLATCWDAKTGDTVWQADFLKEYPQRSPQFGAATSPLLVDGKLVLHVGGKDKGALVGLDPRTGKPDWQWAGDGPGYSSPIVVAQKGQRQIVNQTQKLLAGWSPRGELLWQTKYETAYEQNSVSPLMVGDMLLASGYEKGVSGYVVAGNPPQAQEKWHQRQVTMYMSTPVTAAGRVYGFSQFKQGQLFCLDPQDGRVLWTGPGRQGDNAALLIAGETLFAQTTAGDLVVCRVGAEKYEELARYRVAESPVWAHAVLDDRGVLVKDFERLTYWTWK